MKAPLPLKRPEGKFDNTLIIKPFGWEDWNALWQLRSFQLVEQGILVDPTPGSPDLSSPYEHDYHRIESIYLNGRGNFWIAWLGDQPVGHIGAQDMGDFIELRRMYVRDSFRRCGIGTHLVCRLIDRCGYQGVDLIKLWTDRAGPGWMLYKKLGFREVEMANEDTKWITNEKGEIRMTLTLNCKSESNKFLNNQQIETMSSPHDSKNGNLGLTGMDSYLRLNDRPTMQHVQIAGFMDSFLGSL
jgi:GNAT superfamily N-acetyltransferase